MTPDIQRFIDEVDRAEQELTIRTYRESGYILAEGKDGIYMMLIHGILYSRTIGQRPSNKQSKQ